MLNNLVGLKYYSIFAKQNNNKIMKKLLSLSILFVLMSCNFNIDNNCPDVLIVNKIETISNNNKICKYIIINKGEPTDSYYYINDYIGAMNVGDTVRLRVISNIPFRQREGFKWKANTKFLDVSNNELEIIEELNKKVN